MNRIEEIARVCHEANRAWCEVNGDHSQRDCQSADPWQRESAIERVEFALANPHAPESAQHDAWMADKIRNGWIFGQTKDTAAKTHTSIVPFDELP